MATYIAPDGNPEVWDVKPNGYFTPEEWAALHPVLPPTLDEQQAAFTAAIQRRLDVFVQTRGYDNIFTAATYATSSDPQFAVEGQYAVLARDLTWRTAYQILAEVLGGLRPPPTIDDILAELPALEWPS